MAHPHRVNALPFPWAAISSFAASAFTFVFASAPSFPALPAAYLNLTRELFLCKRLGL
jgi:hypothetical protein